MFLIRRTGLVLALCLLPVARPAGASALPFPSGSRLRVTAPALQVHRRVATLLESRRDTLSVRFKGDEIPVDLPVDRVTRLEISRGRHGHIILGAVTGLLVGMVAGGAYGASAGGKDAEWVQGELFVLGAMAGTTLGLVAGGVAGALVRTERWQAVPPGMLRPTLGAWRPAGGGLGLKASLTF